ncbi:MAG: hypothetical protein IPI14_07235 [Polaromonas sp.]|nr:hypothetical protein [Polaromonas sp.]
MKLGQPLWLSKLDAGIKQLSATAHASGGRDWNSVPHVELCAGSVPLAGHYKTAQA